MRHISTIFLTAVWLGLPAYGEQAGRILRAFNFEERELGNFEELPMHWVKVEGPGMPHYVNGHLATDRARSGRFSFRLDLNGGSALYRYPAGMIPVRPGGHYRVEAHVTTTPLRHARARLTAYFTDIDHRPLVETVRHSILAGDAAATTAGMTDSPRAEDPPGGARGVSTRGGRPAADPDWQRLILDLSADDERAAFVVLEVGLLQPEHYAQTTLGSRALFNQEIRGSAWFDDITVSQVPHVRLSSDAAGNIFAPGQSPRLRVLVSDRSTSDLSSQLVVRDAVGRIVYQRTESLNDAAGVDPARAGEPQGTTPGRKRLVLPVPDLPPGWYEARLVIHSHEQLVGDQSLRFALLGEDHHGSAGPDARFGVVATHVPVELWEDLPEVLDRLGAGRVKLPIWTSSFDVYDHSERFDRLLERLRERNIRVTACLVDLPPVVQQQLRRSPEQGPARWADLPSADPEIWQPRLAFLISRYAGFIDQWQLGADGDESFATEAAMEQVAALVYRDIRHLARRPELTIPWPAWQALPDAFPAAGDARSDSRAMPRRLAITVPPSILPSQLPLYLRDWVDRPDVAAPARPRQIDLTVRPLDRDQYGREVQLRDLAQRMVHAVAGGAERIDVPLPLRLREASGHLLGEPDELMLVVRTLITTLGGARFVGRVPVDDDIDAFLFDRGRVGILAIWRRGSDSAPRELNLNPRASAVRIDIWGRATPLLRHHDGSAEQPLRLQIGPTPTFLVGIDAHAAQLRAGLTLDRPLIESSFRPHVRRLRFTNPYPQAIAGTLRLRPPSGWTINPPTFSFTLNPGERFDRELTIEFPYNSFAGPKTVQAQLEVQAGEALTINLPLVITLGLADVGMQTIASRDGDDLVVQQIISNYGDAPIDYTAFAIFPGHARQERLVTNLAPGGTTVRLYRFSDVSIPTGAVVRSGLRELAGTRILNDEVPVQ